MIPARAWGLAALVLLGPISFYVATVAADVRLVAPAPTPIVLDRHGLFITQAGHWSHGRVEYGYWQTEPPPRVVAATLALEDRRFWWHPGVDPVAVLRATWSHLTGQGGSGASTIAMQVARMQHPRPRTLWAKLVEAGTALGLTARYGHAAVLAQYLRLAPYGEGSHGIGHAARWYFDRPAADLTWSQAALLAAVPQSPARLALRRPGLPAARRAARALATLGVAEDPAAEAGVVTAPRRPSATAAVLRLECEATAVAAPEPLLHAALDLRLTRWVQDLAARHVQTWRQEGAQQAAVMVVRRRSREVLALSGSVPGPGSGFDFTAVPRSPGSTLKPFFYAEALESGLLSPHDIMADRPEGAAGIHNADGAFLGALLPRQALANSRNVPAATLLRRIGVATGFRYLRRLGLHRLEGGGERYGLALALGAMPTRLDALVAAYDTLAEDGVAAALVTLPGHGDGAASPVIAPEAARLVGRFLSDPMARLPSFPRYGASEYPFAVAVKTGTSQGYRDAWTVAWSGDVLVGVWIGRPDGGPMSQLSGGRVAAGLAQEILLGLHGRNRADLVAGDLAAPVGWREAELCTDTGNPDVCPDRLAEFVRPGTRPAAAPTARLSIVQPEPDTHIWRNPETPPALNRLMLRATAPGVPQIVWMVDSRPFAVTAPDQPVPWTLEPGRHRFQVRLPLQPDVSPAVTVVVE